MEDGSELSIIEVCGGMHEVRGPDLLPGGRWLEARDTGATLAFRLDPGTLRGKNWLTADMLLDGENLAVFRLNIKEKGREEGFGLVFGLINMCCARIRLPLTIMDQGRWRLEREGAWLKPICTGERVDAAAADAVSLEVMRKGPRPVRFCMTPLLAVDDEPERITRPLLPAGKLLDEMGQSTIHSWPGRTRGVEELRRRLGAQAETAAEAAWPGGFSRFGGWKEKKSRGGGFFSTYHDGNRWWLLDPDGHYFWSAGMDCVRSSIELNCDGLEDALTWIPGETGEFADAWTARADRRGLNYLAANFTRVFGHDWHDKWADIALAALRRTGFNTVANWSEWDIAAGAAFPYVRAMSPSFRRTGCVYRDFPDVFSDEFIHDAADFAVCLEQTAGDPAMIGYFMMNEPTWGFAGECPAAGMLYTSPGNGCRNELVRFLRDKYADARSLARAWKMEVDFPNVQQGLWREKLTAEAVADLEAFSEIMVERFFSVLDCACRKVDPHHLNLGIRYCTVPPRWAMKGMQCFDVFSMNCYRETIPAEEVSRLAEALAMPVIIGEWHFGALDAGLPASGIGHVHGQADRARAYRLYLENAAAHPDCVGAHWFTLYDQSALGRYDGENYQIGFLDICNRPYEEICSAARQSHSVMYDVAAGNLKPYDDAPEYLPKLFI